MWFYGRVFKYKPHEWKGTVEKKVMELRIQKHLTTEELKIVELPAKSLAHNVWDAAGIGLKHLKRL